MQELKVLSQSKEYQESETIKRTSKKYHNQMFCQGVLKSCIQGVLQKYIKRMAQSKVLPGQSKEIPGIVTIRNTARDRHNQKYCQGPPQSKVLPGSVVIKYIKGVHQIEVHQGSAIIKMITKECNMQKYCQKCYNQKYCKGISQRKNCQGV